MKPRIKALQKTIIWYKKTKAVLKNKVQKLEAGNINTSLSLSVDTVVDKEGSNNDSDEENFDEESSMDYSSLEESSQSAAEMNEDITRNTVR